jgi:serine/threonine protein kinase
MLEVEIDSFVSLVIPQRVGNYTFRNVIGQGSSSAVLAATDRSSGRDYALKVMSHSDLVERNLLQKVERELTIIQTVNHEHIIRFHEIFRQDDLIFIVTEKCDGGDLLSYIIDGHIKDKQTLKRLFRQIALAVQYLHQRGLLTMTSNQRMLFLIQKATQNSLTLALRSSSRLLSMRRKVAALFTPLLNS